MFGDDERLAYKELITDRLVPFIPFHLLLLARYIHKIIDNDKRHNKTPDISDNPIGDD